MKKPYYQEPNITIYCGDCLEIMPELEPVDLVLTDPPYNMTNCSWDTDISKGFWKYIKNRTVMTTSQPFTSIMVMSNYKNFKHEWIWQKNRGSNFLNTKYCPMKEHENILVFYAGKYFPQYENRISSGLERSKHKYNPSNSGKREAYSHFEQKNANHRGNEQLRVPSSIQKFNIENGLHPTQKPVKLFSYLVLTYSECGDLLIDPFMGSGTTLVAAKELGRKAIGIEIDEKYCEIAVDRLRQEILPFRTAQVSHKKIGQATRGNNR